MKNKDRYFVELSNLHRKQKRVGIPLSFNRCGRTMARKNLRFTGESQQPPFNGVDNLIVVAARQVRAPNAPGKERVAGNEQIQRRKV